MNVHPEADKWIQPVLRFVFCFCCREYWLSMNEETQGPHRNHASARSVAKLLAKYRRTKLDPFQDSAKGDARRLLDVLVDRVDRALLHAESHLA